MKKVYPNLYYKKIEEIREFEEIKEHLDITAESLVSEGWLKKKQNVVLKIFKEKDDNNWFSICGKEKTTIKLEGQGNINLYCLNEKNMDLKMKDQKWAFFEIKINEEKEVYLYCSDVESIEDDFFGYGIFYLKEHISISVIACNTVNVKNMGNMFSTCEKLKNLDVKKFNTTNVKDMENMFYNFSSLENLKIGPNFNIRDDTNTTNMFSRCVKINENTKIELYNSKEIINYLKKQTENENNNSAIK